MSEGLIEITENLKSEYEEKVAKLIGYSTNISGIKCSFCSKPLDHAKLMISGDRCFICDECVTLCNEIVNEKLNEKDSIDEK